MTIDPATVAAPESDPRHPALLAAKVCSAATSYLLEMLSQGEGLDSEAIYALATATARVASLTMPNAEQCDARWRDGLEALRVACAAYVSDFPE